MIEVPRRSAGRATIVAAVAIVVLAIVAVRMIGRPEMFASNSAAPTEASRESAQQAAAPETRPGEIGSPTLNAPADAGCRGR